MTQKKEKERNTENVKEGKIEREEGEREKKRRRY
jgi:hypothetical protein